MHTGLRLLPCEVSVERHISAGIDVERERERGAVAALPAQPLTHQLLPGAAALLSLPGTAVMVHSAV